MAVDQLSRVFRLGIHDNMPSAVGLLTDDRADAVLLVYHFDRDEIVYTEIICHSPDTVAMLRCLIPAATVKPPVVDHAYTCLRLDEPGALVYGQLAAFLPPGSECHDYR